MFDDMYGPSERPRSSTMAGTSLFCGVASIIFCSTFYLALPCGALAVIFAVLSRIDGGMPGRSKTGIVCGCCGMAATIIVTAVAVRYALTNPQMRAYVERYIQTYTGDFDFDLEEQLGGLLPFLSDDNSDGDASPQDDSGSDAPVQGSDSSVQENRDSDTPAQDDSGNDTRAQENRGGDTPAQDDSGSDAPAHDSPFSDEPSDNAPAPRDGERTYL